MKTRTLLLLLLLVFTMGTSKAQPKKRAFPVDEENSPDPRLKMEQMSAPEDPTVEDPDAVPITGLEYLILGGGALGIIRKARKRKQQQDSVSPNV